MRRLFLVILTLTLLLAACETPPEAPTPTPVTAPTATLTPSPRPSATATLTPSPTPTATSTATLTPTPIPAARIPIIEYHDPDFKMNDQVQMTQAWFGEQMAWLSQNGYTTLSAEDLAAYLDGMRNFPQKSVVLSFDLGTAKRPLYADVVIPTLKKYGFKAIFFILNNDSVVVDECNKPNKTFCYADLRGWASEGIISIASHGISHPDYTKTDTLAVKWDVEQSKKILTEKTGFTPIAFAYPYDAFSPAAQAIVKNAGYQYAVAGNTRKELAAYPSDAQRYQLPRVYPYSNPRLYPLLTGSYKTFADVIGELTRSGTAVALRTSTATPAALSSAEQFLKQCKTLPADLFTRQQLLAKFNFTPDLSAAARAQLPGFSTFASCNAFPGNQPEAIVIHYTVGDLKASLYGFAQANGTSAHYLIDRDGKVTQVVPEELGAMHASCTGARSTCLASCPICDDDQGKLTEPYLRSIGIELVNKGRVPQPASMEGYFEDYLHSYGYTYWEDYPEVQVRALQTLVMDIASRWNIPIDNNHILGHYRINQKVDPGPALNLFWERMGYPPREPIFTEVP